jgi:uncharacterized protein (TIGR02145 family)
MKIKTTYLTIALVTVLLFGVTILSDAALNYTISFTASGATALVGDVQVQNLTKGTTVTVPAGNTLILTDQTTSIDKLSGNNAGIRISKNAGNGTSILTFYSAQTGSTQVYVYTPDGRKVSGQTTRMEEGDNSVELSLPSGMYVVRIAGSGYTYSTKLQCMGNNASKTEIQFLGNVNAKASTQKKSKEIATTTTTMNYITGDQLVFKAYSGNCTTLFTDVPTASKTINIEFAACQDASGNNYTVVKIGTQTWMAENLKTAKYRNGDAIPNVTDNSAWAALSTGAWCNYNNDAAMGTKYGKLYNWYAVAETRNIAPTGWHVASDEEWNIMETYVAAFLGYSPRIGKALASATTDWRSDLSDALSMAITIGYNLSKNNSSLFSGLPSGYRSYEYDTFYLLTQRGYWWGDTSTLLCRYLKYNDSYLTRDFYDARYGLSVRCVKDASSTIPKLSTTAVSVATSVVATSSSNITSDGGSAVTARGVCWSTSPQPTIALSSKTVDGAGIGSFNTSVTGLTANTIYYLRSYATNSIGTAYSNEVSFTTLAAITDVDGNVYNTVVIGTQTWMTENLKTTKYRNGDAIPNVTENAAWAGLTTGAWCNYNNDVGTGTKYGKLYNWFAVTDNRKIAPLGWHVATDAEWSTLQSYVSTHLDFSPSVAKALASNTDWMSSSYSTGDVGNNLTNNNDSFFCGLPGGCRSYGFNDLGNKSYWWTATANGTTYVWYRSLYYDNSIVDRYSGSKWYGYSVRCLKD